jgi:hypothetical protein
MYKTAQQGSRTREQNKATGRRQANHVKEVKPTT